MIYEHASQYSLSLLPYHHPERRYFTVTVEDRGDGRFAVLHLGYAFDADGNSEYEASPSSRDDQFRRYFRHSLEDALDIARDLVATVDINGTTAQDWLDRASEEN